ncbi:MAG: bifunctional UDP-3-O-[3-hydroxymyristoyl] N-acetylglucosamine deacetylase/3-hydroxyacyl-ACP dehydratase [Puniceicoccales bacterium]|jgi:UDP-3-O-[3-hydroxymyristoyl] N-acetylglucosamine deacetylase/3-hydroxyacyl-[acyl-carrier-protein] dehydratase|nr:bifunctional UDP-3-O-[3-hydroxymyristoyl] N-acetylglucosamine deacetylase/3-hydroxyacyl-ACP dehydratase [Puniceicoccales bacterium]
MKQRGILREGVICGKSLHTGKNVTLCLKPLPPCSGIIFRRTDLANCPELRPDIETVGDLVRCTTIVRDDIEIHTVEHLLGAINGLGIDNILIEIDGDEPPILDGSAKCFTNLLREAQIVEYEDDRECFALEHPVCISEGNRSIIAIPYDGLKITCTSTDDHGIHTQHLAIDISEKNFSDEIASARTFALYEDVEPLLRMGKIQGGSLDSAIILKGNQIIAKEPLRFRDEMVRHKILDILGDITLLGKPLNAHIIAVRPGHALNAKLTRELRKQMHFAKMSQIKREPCAMVSGQDSGLDIRHIIKLIPHRYPFLLIDRILKINENELIALKNVTINEPHFQGHFPEHPVMPGVLQIEAMAQAAGILMLHRANLAGKLAYFMSCDRVKFRRIVEPGDQLQIEIKLLKHRGKKIGIAEGICRVGKNIASTAELMFTIADDHGEE